MIFAIALIAAIGIVGMLVTIQLNFPATGGALKVLATGLFLCLVIATTQDSTCTKAFLVLAFGFIFLGDVFLSLLLKIFPSKSILFIGGLGSFLIGYALLTISIAIKPDTLSGFTPPVSLAAGILVGAGISQIGLLGIENIQKTTAIAILMYIVVISALVITSMVTLNAGLIVSALLLYVSDSIIAHTTFGKLSGTSSKFKEYAVVTPYYVGIAGILIYML